MLSNGGNASKIKYAHVIKWKMKKLKRRNVHGVSLEIMIDVRLNKRLIKPSTMDKLRWTANGPETYPYT